MYKGVMATVTMVLWLFIFSFSHASETINARGLTGRATRALDPFEHLGIVYPDIAQESSKPKRLKWYEKGRRLLIKVSISEVESGVTP